MRCPICNEKVSMAMEHFMVAVEIPYLNIFFHMICYKNNLDILHKTIEVWYNSRNNEDKIKENGTNKSKNKRNKNQ